jgi:CheY-like chemotaxis protein
MNPLILVVDDDPGVRAVLRRWITTLGYRVLVAATADEALALLRSGDVEVAICDIRMPGHDGVWLVDRLRHEYPLTSIVLATGIADMDPHLTLQTGVVNYLVKPFDAIMLGRAIEEALADCHARRRQVVEHRPQRLLEDGVIEGVLVSGKGPRRLGSGS